MYSLISETYNYISSGAGSATLTGIIWALAGGFAVGMILSFYNMSFVGETVRRLYKSGAFSETTALTLNDLGLSPTKLRTHALRDGGALRKYVKIANAGEAAADGKGKVSYDFNAARLYLSEDTKYKAAVRYEQRGRLSPVIIVLALVVIAGVALGATFAVPKILKILDNLITSIVQK